MTITTTPAVTTRDQASDFVDAQAKSAILTVPTDAVISVMANMDLSTLSAFSLSCKYVNALAKDEPLWTHLLHKHFPMSQADASIPYDGSYLESYKQQHLFHSNLTNGVYAQHTLRGHMNSIYSLAISRNTLFSGAWDKTIKLWDLETGVCITTLEGQKNLGCSLAISGNNLFSGSLDTTIMVWDLEAGACIKTLKGHESGVTSFAVSGNKLFSGSNDKTIKVWDLETGVCIKTLEGHEEGVFSLAISENKLFSGSRDKTIKVWDLETGVCITTLEGHESDVYSLAISGNKLFSGSNDKTIKVWDLETGVCITTLEGHESDVYSLAISGNKLFSGSNDKTIKVWDLETGVCITTLEGHESDGYSLAISGSRLVSSSDNTIKMWDFGAPNKVIFGEIATLFRSKDPKDHAEAMDRFSRMSVKARNKIYGEIYHILKPFQNDYMGCGEDAFYDRKGQSSTPAEKAQAIENYLKNSPQ